MTSVVALGGNALVRRGERGTAVEQLANLRRAFAGLAPLFSSEEERVVVTHGNGPQVGNELLRHERAADEAPPLPLYVAVAQTQAEIGTLVARELTAATGRSVVCVLTRVRVDAADPAFEEPTKPVGPFYDEATARELERDRGWLVQADAGRGWRRVVPSPAPLEVVEAGAIRALLEDGSVVVAGGGGGIPVVARHGRLDGVDAVVDKDRTSALLAGELGATRLVIVTDVPALQQDFGTDRAREVRDLSPDEAEALLPDLDAGSMRPKIESAAAFVRATGGEAIVTSAELAAEALAGRAGTRIS